jgi:glycogen synthase
MRVLTFGWDYPPIRNGGLGVACQGLTEELLEAGVDVVFVLPRRQPVDGRFTCIFADGTTIQPQTTYVVNTPLVPYGDPQSWIEMFLPSGERFRISRRIIDEVYNYAHAADTIAKKENFALIHAHDWTSYLAGVAAKRATGKPLVLHVHATSFDQAGGGNVDPHVYDIEARSFAYADSIVAISNYTRNMVIERYGVSPDKIEVVHNGIKPHVPEALPPVLAELKAQGKKIIFYHGRITIQKGVDYFVRAARHVVDVNPNVVFIISGWGDMEHQIMHLVGSLGLSSHVIFAGALWDTDRDRMYQSADLLVMPSVSEPFGLVPLEAIQHGTPVLISKQSGVSEVLTHALKVDFWDVEEMANKMLAAISYPVLNAQLVTEGKKEVSRLTWRRAAEKVFALYRSLLARMKRYL